jgi:predicted phosphodiesterase
MLAIISDIHGNHIALSAVLAEIDKMPVEKIICLGDVGGYYCQINECCETLRERNIFSLMGNHDWYLAKGEKCPRSNSANRCLDYQRKAITQSNLQWLSELAPQGRVDDLNIVHGGWNNPIDEYLVPSDAYFSNLSGQYFASGHTHLPCTWSGDIKKYCNPGSVGQPRDGISKASFAIFDGCNFNLYRKEYDIAAIQQKMKEAGFDQYYSENLSRGKRIGEI